MSVLAVSDFVFGDLLTDLKIKPWWEKLRGYCFAASAVAALFMTYIVLPTPSIKCTPLIVNNAIKINFSTTQSYLINNYCSNQAPWFISFAGVAALCCTVFILMAASWWAHHPEVINSFRTFAQFEEIIGNLKLTPDQLCLLSSKPLNSSSTEECREVRKACLLLWKYESPIRVELFYQVRNAVLLVMTLTSTALSLFILTALFDGGNNFECSLTKNDEFEIYGTVDIMRLHFCSHNATKKLIPFMLAFVITLSSQIVFVIMAILKMRTAKVDIMLPFLLSKNGRRAARYSRFMTQFWKNSKPVSCGTLNQLVEYIFYGAFSKLNSSMLQDVEMIGLYSSIRSDGGSLVIEFLDKIVREDNFSLNSSTHNEVVACIKYIKSVTWSRPLKTFMDYLYEQKYWELFWNVLALEKTSKSDIVISAPYIEYLRSLEIDFDEIDQPFSFGRSILYYTIPDELSSAKAVHHKQIIVSRNMRVHFDGKSMQLKDFAEYKPCPTSGIYQLFNDLRLMLEGAPTQSHKSIGIMFEEHLAATKKLKPRLQDLSYLGYVKPYEKYENYLLKFAEKLSRYKFYQWDRNIRNLATFASSEKQWPVLVELLNAFIVLEPYDHYSLRDPPNFNCEVVNFTVTSERKETLLLHKAHINPSILYYALRKPHYHPKFLFTAIRHILNCTRGQEKIVRCPNGREESAINFLRESGNNLDANDIEIITWMLEESMKPLHEPADSDELDREEGCDENESLLPRSKSVSNLSRPPEVKIKRHRSFLNYI